MKKWLVAACCIFFLFPVLFSQPDSLSSKTEASMYRATKYMMDHVSLHGGFVWYYLPDLSRRWGEMEAYKTMIWVQDGGTVGVGHTLLDAYHATHNEYYYDCAQKVAGALIWGQSHEGGWNYMIDFGGDNSLKKWYATIGKNGWRLEEFQHYYGNDTYDDDVSSDAARFLLRMYLEKLDPVYKPSLDKAIGFLLRSQYPNGGWPQRYPLKYEFAKAGHPDYSSFYTFNDDVIWENILFLIQCYETLGEERFLNPIKKGMDFYLLSQKPNGAWGEQYNLQMQVSGARTYEPAAYLPKTTFGNCLLLLKFYEYTGDKKFLATIPKAISWLEKVKLPETQTESGRYTHPLFVNLKTDKPLYVHRKGSNVTYGYYYTDTVDKKLPGHMFGKTVVNIQYLKEQYNKITAISPDEISSTSPIRPGAYTGKSSPQSDYDLKRGEMSMNHVPESMVTNVITSLDEQNRWLVKHVMISNPYSGDGKLKEPTDQYATTHVGDITDTSPFRDTSDQLYLSTPAYIRNMSVLISYLKETKEKKRLSINWSLPGIKNNRAYQPEESGHPKTVSDEKIPSVFFNGVDDGFIFSRIPVSGWKQFTIEVMIKPDGDGPGEPRFMHFEDTLLNRGTLEARLTKNREWYLDMFLKNGKNGKGLTLIDSTLLHPTDKWYWVALVYDGQKMYSYVNGHKELEGFFDFPAMTAGKTAVGVRLNKVNWFRGNISEIWFHPVAMNGNTLQKTE